MHKPVKGKKYSIKRLRHLSYWATMASQYQLQCTLASILHISAALLKIGAPIFLRIVDVLMLVPGCCEMP